ncbi:MAG: NAD-dependent epimerase/dehydratase family protein, partial [Thermomicrobiales bacterium]
TTDLHDIGQIAGAMHEASGVIHLGAIPNPYGHADEVVFANNTQATFAVLQAASLLGVKKAVIASSVSAYGAAWSPTPLLPRYVPLDETHPMDNHDAYGLSKEVDERTAEMFARRDGMQIAAMRFHWVGHPDEIDAIGPAGMSDEDLVRSARILWGYVDVRDAASACRLAIEADFGGFEAFNIVAPDTQSLVPTEELLRTLAPSVEVKAQMPGTSSAISTEKAQRLLGWTCQHGWRR